MKKMLRIRIQEGRCWPNPISNFKGSPDLGWVFIEAQTRDPERLKPDLSFFTSSQPETHVSRILKEKGIPRVAKDKAPRHRQATLISKQVPVQKKIPFQQ